ncbi:MAG: PEP-CTERM sorting domain-containing protein [Phycisphaeraceae bacterium]|nr:PEP-CTERM sorting domain-containing protein [Phycisphaeraceae bacterium]
MDARTHGRNHCALGAALAIIAGAAGHAFADIHYHGFDHTAGLNILGTSHTTADPLGGPNKVLRLTAAEDSTVGAIWATDKLRVGLDWETQISFRISERGGPGGLNDFAGADGFALVIQAESPNLIAVNQSTLGGGIGYNQLTRSIAIEFDTWKNDRALDPNANHISVQAPLTGWATTSHMNDSLAIATDIPDLSDGSIHSVRISYISGVLNVEFSNVDSPVLSVALDIPGILDLTDGLAYVGFTSATGGCWEHHDLYGWSFTIVPAPSSAALLALGGLLGSRRRR